MCTCGVWCVHVVLCALFCGCVVVCCVCTCGVWCWCCVWCVVLAWCVVKLGTRKTPRVYVQNASVCEVRTSPCVPATGPHVLDMRACCRYTRRRPDLTHGGVLNVHTGGFLFFLSLCCSLSRSFFPLLFSCLVSLLTCLFLFFLLFSLFSFIFSFCTHRDEIRQTSDSTN